MISNWVWTRVTTGVVRRSNKIQKHRAPVDTDRVRPIPIEKRYPGLVGTPLTISDITPDSERTHPLPWLVLQAVLALKGVIGLGSSYPEPYSAEGAPYPKEFAGIALPPVLPEDFAPNADWIAGVSMRGPYSIMTRKSGDAYELDLRHIEALAPRQPFLRSGGLARLVRAGPDKLRTEYIELEGKKYAPGSPEYPQVARRFLAGLSSHMTFVEHLINCHMITAGSFVLATYETLPAKHALRYFLQPFLIETMRVNNDNIDGLIKSEASNVPSYSGYPLATLDRVLRDCVTHFDLSMMDPEQRAKAQGTLNEPGFVTVESRVELFRLFRKTTERFCRDVLKTIDADTLKWAQLVDKYIPNGIRKFMGVDDLSKMTLDQFAHFLAVATFTSSVTHYVVADTVREYAMQFHIMPPAVASDGKARLGMVLEKMNSITIAGVLRYKLLDDDVPFLDEGSKAVWKELQSGLKAYQKKVESDPKVRPYLIEPDKIPSSIHA